MPVRLIRGERRRGPGIGNGKKINSGGKGGQRSADERSAGEAENSDAESGGNGAEQGAAASDPPANGMDAGGSGQRQRRVHRGFLVMDRVPFTLPITVLGVDVDIAPWVLLPPRVGRL